MKKIAKLALPNGSLESKTVALFAAAGWSIKREDRQALGVTDCPFAETVFFTRPQAIPRLVANGICGAGVCGADFVVEELCANPSSVLIQLADLAYSKKTNGPARVVLFSAAGAALAPQDIQPKSTVYSEYPAITRRFFEKTLKIPGVIITPSPGSTEGHVAIGEYQYGVGVVEEGKTLAANKLRIIAELLVSGAVLIAGAPQPDAALSLAHKLGNASQKEK